MAKKIFTTVSLIILLIFAFPCNTLPKSVPLHFTASYNENYPECLKEVSKDFAELLNYAQQLGAMMRRTKKNHYDGYALNPKLNSNLENRIDSFIKHNEACINFYIPELSENIRHNTKNYVYSLLIIMNGNIFTTKSFNNETVEFSLITKKRLQLLLIKPESKLYNELLLIKPESKLDKELLEIKPKSKLDNELLEIKPESKEMNKLLPMDRYNEKKYITQIERVIDEMVNAAIAFNYPTSVNIEDTALIELRLSLTKTIDELIKTIQAEGTKEGNTILVHDFMEASLTSTHFQIIPITDPVQPITKKLDSYWKWEIKPMVVGRQQIHLTLKALITVDGEATKKSICTFDKVIEVEVTLTQKVSQFFKLNWQWGWTAILLPMALWIREIWKKRKNKSNIILVK